MYEHFTIFLRQIKRIVYDGLNACSPNTKSFYHILKVAKRTMKIIYIVFLKNLFFEAKEPFWAQKYDIVITLDLLQGFLNFPQPKRRRGASELF